MPDVDLNLQQLIFFNELESFSLQLIMETLEQEQKPVAV